MQARNTIAAEDSAIAALESATERRAAERDGGRQPVLGVEFLSNLAHQLRSPLSSLRVWVDLLSDPAALASPDDARRMVDGIDRATSRLERQISDILDAGYLEAGTLTFEVGLVDLVEQVSRAVKDAEHAANSRRIQFALDFNDEPATVLASETRLRQIVACLVSNAVRFSPVDGTISIATGLTPRIAGRTSATTILEPPENRAGARFQYVCVSDRGPGIPEHQHRDIFRPFHRAVRKDAHGGGGSGLGLAIALGLVRLHDGGMWLRSSQDGGAEFEFAIPADPPGLARTDLN